MRYIALIKTQPDIFQRPIFRKEVDTLEQQAAAGAFVYEYG